MDGCYHSQSTKFTDLKSTDYWLRFTINVICLVTIFIWILGCSRTASTTPPSRTLAELDLPLLTVDNTGDQPSVHWPNKVEILADRESQVALPIALLGAPIDFHVLLHIKNNRDIIVQSTAGSITFSAENRDSATLVMNLGRVPKGNYKYEVAIFKSPHGLVAAEGELLSK